MEKVELGRREAWLPFLSIFIWFLCGYTMIIFNKMLISEWHFHYPIFLTSWHCLLATILTRVLAHFTNLLPAVKDAKMTSQIYFTMIIPIAAFFACGLMLGNSAYQYISVAYIQMIKALNVVPLLLLYYAFGMEKRSTIQIISIIAIAGGVWLSSIGELRFSWIGFLVQFAAVLSDVLRTFYTDRTLKGMSIDTLSLMYYTAPLAFLFISLIFAFTEKSTFPWHGVQDMWIVLLLNGLVAFSVNFSSVFAIQCTSGLVLSICGPLRDIIIILSSSVIFTSPVTALQGFGFSLSLAGLALYRVYKIQPALLDQAVVCLCGSDLKKNERDAQKEPSSEDEETNLLLSHGKVKETDESAMESQ